MSGRILISKVEVAAMPVGLVVLDAEDCVLRKDWQSGWNMTGSDEAWGNDDIALPARVLYDPTEDE